MYASVMKTERMLKLKIFAPQTPFSIHSSHEMEPSVVKKCSLLKLSNKCLGRSGSVGLVIIARKGITTHLILRPDNHQQNDSRQGIECMLHMELDVKGKKSIGRDRKHTRVVGILVRP